VLAPRRNIARIAGTHHNPPACPFGGIEVPNVWVVVKLAGAFIAFLLGSGFATGQEIMQFFVSEGLRGIGGCLIFLAGASYLATSLLLAGQRHGLHSGDAVYHHYAGPLIGTAFSWYAVVVLYSVYVVMLAGTGALLQEHLGIPVYLGAALMALAVFATLFLGLHAMVDVIGSIGPVLVVLIIVVAVAALLHNPRGVAAGSELAATLDVLHASPSWWMSGLVYTALCTLGLAGILPPMGAAVASGRDLVYAGIAGPLLFTLALVLCTLALLSGLPEVNGRMIPMLHLATGAVPAVAPFFPWIILAGIFTTAAPLLWIAVVKFTADGSPRYRALTAALSVLGFGCGIALPFDRLLNVIYPSVGYSGMLLIGCILLRQIRTRSFA
jgi:uncharacterized membrane protein YkvI